MEIRRDSHELVSAMCITRFKQVGYEECNNHSRNVFSCNVVNRALRYLK